MPSVPVNAVPRRLKIAVMGGEGVGKTSIIRGIVSDPIAKLASICNTDMGLSYHVNIGNISMDITEVSLSTVDNISPLLDLNPAIQTSDAFILVYAVDDLASFDYLETLKDTIVQSRSSDVPVIVVGHKVDSIRCGITYEVVDCLVSIDWEMYYTETSAMNDGSVTTILPSLFHHQKLRSHKFPSEIKTEYGSRRQSVYRRKTVNCRVKKVDKDKRRMRAKSESWNQKSNKEKENLDADETDETDTDLDVFASTDSINENRKDSIESMTFKSLLTGRTQNKTTDMPWHPSNLANLLKTARPRTPTFSFFNDLLSPGCSTNTSSRCPSPSDKISSDNSSPTASSESSSVFKFILEGKDRSRASSPLSSYPNNGFSLSLDPAAAPKRQRSNTCVTRRHPRTEEAMLLANRRKSHSESTKLDTVLGETRSDWVSSVIRFLKK